RLANYCIKLTDNTFQNVRQRAGSCLATCAFFYHKDAFYYPELDEKFKYLKIGQVIDEINGKSLLLNLLVDGRFEVREASAETLSGLVRAGIISVDEQLVKSAETLASSPKQSIERHSGVLALASIVLAFPYSVPSFLPKVLMHLCKHATEPQPIYGTVKRALSEFKRTHQDEWHEHKLEFTEDQ
uniref:Proteasome activator complex subunit 4 C-terminal domain-containing protein n=1 Tax=Meloidogyne javanica TaxID=6303 RepID=A0A915MLI2_MELJA